MERPEEIKSTLKKLESAGFEAYIVGGCVRDLLMDKKPKDWDVTTNATPEEIQKVFPESFYENKFGTVGVKTESSDETLKVIEITTYRIESKYTDKRHPDEIKFASKLDDDLKRRDFTINALAMNDKGEIVDLFDGQKDIKNKLIRAVGDAKQRFSEDALRMMRAIRLAIELDFEIDKAAKGAIKENSGWIAAISKERIRDELIKIINHTPLIWLQAQQKRKRKSNEITKEEFEHGPARTFELMREVGLLRHILPELEEGYGVTQNKHHVYTVWEHNLRSFVYAIKENFNFWVRLAALFHDIAKPRTKRGEGPDSTFYGHDVVSSRMTIQIMNRLKFPRNDIEKVSLFVRYHLFQSDPEKITDSAVRRVVRNVGKDNIWDLINVRLCDRIGSGVPKAEPYRLRKFLVLLEKALREPVSLKQLKINGEKIMEVLKIVPGPKVGYILNALMSEILDDPQKNKEEYLERRSLELAKLSDKELEKLASQAKEKMAKIEYKKEEETKQKYWVS